MGMWGLELSFEGVHGEFGFGNRNVEKNLEFAKALCGPSERSSTLEVDAAIGKMKQGKSGGPTGVVSKMLKETV